MNLFVSFVSFVAPAVFGFLVAVCVYERHWLVEWIGSWLGASHNESECPERADYTAWRDIPRHVHTLSPNHPSRAFDFETDS